MAYKTPIVCKEIYLPISPDDSLTIDEYKEKYGIDLKPLFRLAEGGYINFNFPYLTKCFIVMLGYGSENFPNVAPVNFYNNQAYNSGNADGVLTIGAVENSVNLGYGLDFTIDKAKEFEVESIIITSHEI